MKKILVILFLGLLIGCSSDDKSTTAEPLHDPSVAITLPNVAYGSDAGQTMDIYLPAGRSNTTTKTIILIHGGAWIAGDKADFDSAVPVVQAEFPDYAVVNINYRLATTTSPAMPKQIEDIQLIIQKLKSIDYSISNNYAMIGASAGAHLAMLYAYKFDTQHEVKAVADIVGPADFTDPQYLSHPLYSYASLNLIGTATPTIAQIQEVSPALYVNAQSAPTIMFYGGVDPLVPASQGPGLRDKLNAAGVTNEFNFYADGGHGDWSDAIYIEVYAKLSAFLQNHME